MKLKGLAAAVAAAVSMAAPAVSNASVVNTSPIPTSVIVVGDNGMEFVYGAVTSPNAPCCGVQVTLTQGFRLPTAAELVAGFGTLNSLLADFNLLDDDDSNNRVAFQYFNNFDVAPSGNVGDVRGGYINNLNMGAGFYDYAGSAFRTDNNADFFFVRGAQQTGGDVPEPVTLALVGLGLVGVGVSRKKR